jgi:hypothetical protein
MDVQKSIYKMIQLSQHIFLQKKIMVEKNRTLSSLSVLYSVTLHEFKKIHRVMMLHIV